MSLRQHAAKSLIWTLLESGGLSGVSLLALIAFAWLLSPAEMGLGSIALGIVQLLLVPVEILFQDALIQRAEAEDMHFDTAFSATLGLGLMLFVLACACSGLLSQFIGIPEFAPVFMVMNLSLIPMSFGAIVAARQRRNLEFRLLALRSLVGRIGSAVVGIGIAIYGGGVWALVTQQVLLVTLSAASIWLLAANRPRLRFSSRHFYDLIGFGLRSTAVMSANVAAPRIYMLLVGAWLGAASAGYINLAFRAIDMLRDVVASAVVQLALPLFGRFKGNVDALQRSYTEATGFTCIIGFPMFAGLGVCAPEVVSLLFGPQWQRSVPYVALLGLLVLPYFVRVYVMPCMAAAGQPQAALPGLAVTLVFIVAGMAAVGRMSLTMAASVWALRMLVSTPVDALMLRRVSGIGLRAQVLGAGWPLLASVVMVAVIVAERFFLLQGLPPVMRVAAMVLLGSLVYSGMMLLLDRPIVLRLVEFGKSAVSRSTATTIGGITGLP